MLFYISFAKSKDEGGFQGATVVEGSSPESALANATLRGLNPGGEAAIIEVPELLYNEPDVRSYRNRLVSKAEIIGDGGARLGDLPPKMQRRFDEEAAFVCSCCNPPRRHY